jgi:hypothetical protein
MAIPVIDSVVLGGDLYEITLVSVECLNGQQTWVYTVTELNGQDISNWALQICEDATVESYDPPAIVEDPNTGGGQGNCLNINNDIGCFTGTEPVVLQQIKWNVNDDFTTGTFEFTLDECYEIGDVYVSVKAGDACFCGMIQGPICGDVPPSGRGILFI